ARRELEAARDEAGRLREEFEARTGEWDEQRRILEHTLDHAKRKAAEDLETARREAAGVAERVESLEAELAGARGEVADRDERLAAAQRETEALGQRLREAEGALAAAEER